ncbi:MAG: hypothetical protein H6Q90_2827 [Deltaproteobacteria bacterium]|nr:hypothetical protein [Deltaproteobacteria bacterium]
MKRLALAAMMLFAACDKQDSKLDKVPHAATGGAGGASEGALRTLESRVRTLEAANTVVIKPDGPDAAPLAERMRRVEATIVKYQDALEFLNKVYAQQKAQQDQQEASEPDPTATFAVDIAGPLKAGQVEGPNSAIITIVEAWDYA